MAVENVKQSTVRLSETTRLRLKTVAAARRITMEAAFDQAVEFWLCSGPVPQEPIDIAVPRDLRRAHALCARIAKNRDKRPMEALLVILDGLCLLG